MEAGGVWGSIPPARRAAQSLGDQSLSAVTLSAEVFLLALNSALVTAVNVAPTSLYSPWHEITAPALTDNTYRIFTSRTSWRISIKTPLCSSGRFCHRQQRRARMNTHSVCKRGARRVLPRVKHFLLNFGSCVYGRKCERAALLSCEGGLIKDISFHQGIALYLNVIQKLYSLSLSLSPSVCRSAANNSICNYSYT